MSSVDKLKEFLELDPTTWNAVVGLAGTAYVGDTSLANRKLRPRQKDKKVWSEIIIQLGIKASAVEEHDWIPYQWNGETFLANGSDNLLHDFAHFQCAHPDRRFKADFGLGRGPDSTEFTSLAVSSQEADEEETHASTLGILWEIHFGMPFQFTVAHHLWSMNTDAGPQLNWLEEHNLIIAGEPVRNLRMR